MINNFKYKAFISYSRKDANIVSWFHKEIESYKISKNISKHNNGQSDYLGVIFKDTEDLSSHHSLTDALKEALNESEYLIVFCSKNSSQSKYVNEEIEYFRTIRDESKIIPIILDGEPGATKNPNFSDEEESYPLIFREYVPLGIDLRKDSKNKALSRVISKILDIDFDNLWDRQKRRRARNRIYILGLISIFFIMIIYTLYNYINKIQLKQTNEKLVSTLKNTDSRIENKIQTILTKEKQVNKKKAEILKIKLDNKTAEDNKKIQNTVENIIKKNKKMINDVMVRNGLLKANQEATHKNIFINSVGKAFYYNYGYLKKETIKNYTMCIYSKLLESLGSNPMESKLYISEFKKYLPTCQYILFDATNQLTKGLSKKEIFIMKNLSKLALHNPNTEKQKLYNYANCIYDKAKKNTDHYNKYYNNNTLNDKEYDKRFIIEISFVTSRCRKDFHLPFDKNYAQIYKGL